MISAPPDGVLDLFAVPGSVSAVPGGRGGRVVAGDLVLSPHRDPQLHAWLSPQLARLAVLADERPDRKRRDLRIAMPVPARDGSWVVQGWAASRFEAGTTACSDVNVAVAAGRLLHAQLAVTFPQRPPALVSRDVRRDRAERLAFSAAYPLLTAALGKPGASVVRRVEPYLDDRSVGRDQLVHLDLASSLLLDARGAPVVVNLEPAWRPARWAEALAVVEAVLADRAALSVLEPWTTGLNRQAVLRALIYRAFGDEAADLAHYEDILAVVAPELD